MKRFICLYLLLMWLLHAKAQVITKIEYFVDTDPGYQLGTNVPVSPGKDVSASFGINLTGLTPGAHQVVVRVCQDDTLWSTISSALFITVDLGSRPDVNKMEYYVDTDPGYGLGKQVPIATGKDISAGFGIDLSGLLIGFHQVVVRVRDSENGWSIVSSALFYAFPPVKMPVTKMEYFVDTDPGFGLGINVPVTSGYDVSQVFPLSLSGILPGVHTVSVRTRDANGVWSILSSALLIYLDESITNTVTMEYFMNNDPGFGSGSPVLITPGKDITAGFVIDTTGWGKSLHDVFVRVKNANGAWGITNTVMNDNVAMNRNLPAVTVGSGQTACYDAFQFLTVGGNGASFLVQAGGSVSLIAGQKITFYPSSKVSQGGSLHACITSTGGYCSTSATKETEAADFAPGLPANSFFKLYPNPTEGDFTLEMTDGRQPDPAAILSSSGQGSLMTLEIYGIRGERVLSRKMHYPLKQTFSLGDQRPGIYLVRVIRGDRVVMEKIIRK